MALLNKTGQSLIYQIYSAAMPHLAVSQTCLWITYILNHFQALYPVLIILIVAVENSKDDASNGANTSLSQSIRFASAPAPAPDNTESTPMSRDD